MTTVLHPADPNVKVPVGVMIASSRADELHAAAYPVEDGAANTEAAGEQPPAENKPVFEGHQTQELAPQAPAQEVTQQVTPPQDINWEQRYNSMKGRYDKEVPRLNARINDLEAAIAELRQRPIQTPASTTDFSQTKLITPEEETEFGPDFLKVVGKKAKEELLPEFVSLKSQVDQLQASLGNVAEQNQMSAREKTFAYMDEHLPSWRDMNDDPRLIAWLQLPDPYSGAKRQDLLNQAFERNNGPRVAAFFSGFLSEEAATSPMNGQGATDGAQAPKVPLEAFAAPGRAKTAAAPAAPAEKPVFTPAEITRFYTDVSLGKWAGRDAERIALERQIHEATGNGRVR
jgi:hypothetical protein